MRVKLTSKDQLVLPKSASSFFQGVTYLKVSVEDDRIVLTPVRESTIDAIHAEVAELGITEDDVKGIIAQARAGGRAVG